MSGAIPVPRGNGRRGPREYGAYPWRGLRGSPWQNRRALEVIPSREEHRTSADENRACHEIAPPPGRSVPPRAGSNAPSRSASPARGRGERAYAAAGPRAPATKGAGCARSLGSVRQRSNAVTRRWGISPGGKYPHIPP